MSTKHFLLFCFSLVLALTAFAKREPTWMKVMPLPGNATYIYVRETAEGATLDEAFNVAIIHVFEHTSGRLGVPFDSQRALLSLQNGTSYEILSSQYNIPVRLEDTYDQKIDDGRYSVTVLCQVIARRSVAPIWDKGMSASSVDNQTFVMRSVFLPGLGQMGKGYGFGGTVTLLGELGLIGGAVGLNFLAHEQLNVMDACILANDHDGYLSAQNNYYSFRKASYYTWGAAGLLYVWNIIRAATLTPKSEKALSFTPSLINTSTNIYPTVGVTYRF